MHAEGTTVRFTADSLGLLETPDSRWFEPEKMNTGDTGEYVGPHPTLPDWHLIRVNVNGRELLCPCHGSHFVATPESNPEGQ